MKSEQLISLRPALGYIMNVCVNTWFGESKVACYSSRHSAREQLISRLRGVTKKKILIEYLKKHKDCLNVLNIRPTFALSFCPVMRQCKLYLLFIFSSAKFQTTMQRMSNSHTVRLLTGQRVDRDSTNGQTDKHVALDIYDHAFFCVWQTAS